MSIFKCRDVLSIVFQSIPTNHHEDFALINKSCYSVYSKFIETIRKTIPIRIIRRYIPLIVYYCSECDVLTKSQSVTNCSGCSGQLCEGCKKKSFECENCGIDMKYRNDYTFCKKCLKKCPSCNKLKHCFLESCEVCNQEICKDCIDRRWKACKKCQHQVCECGKPITDLCMCYKCGKNAKHKETTCSRESCLSKESDTFRTYCCECVQFEYWTGYRTCPQCYGDDKELLLRLRQYQID